MYYKVCVKLYWLNCVVLPLLNCVDDDQNSRPEPTKRPSKPASTASGAVQTITNAVAIIVMNFIVYSILLVQRVNLNKLTDLR